MRWKPLLFLLTTASCATAVIYDTIDDLQSLEYDFIVVGGGVGGNVIANRLTEDPSTSVLVLEAGGTNENVLNSIVPFYSHRLYPHTPYDWNFTVVPQTNANNRSFVYPRGYILGGTSSINGMVYSRGSVDDWNRYAHLVGDSGWSWDNIQPYIRKNEKLTQPADHHNTTGQFEPSVHGFTGVNSVSLPSYPQPIDSRVIETTRQLPEEFRYNVDYNAGIQYGIGWVQYTIGGGKRSSSATSYLGPQYIVRPNLNVLLHATVARVLKTGSDGGKPILRQVEFRNGATGRLVNVTAKKEVILSAGSIGSPHILLNSGIGDQADLSELGIKTVLNLPSVGRNLSDQLGLTSLWPVNSTTTFEDFTRNATWQAEAFDEWSKHKTGILAGGSANNVGWIRVPKNSTIFDDAPDYAAGPNTAHFELYIYNGLWTYPLPAGQENLTTLAITTVVLSPASRGTVTINSTDPFSSPLIDVNLISAKPDIAVMREAIRSARRFVSAPAWEDYIIGPSLNTAQTDDELDEYIRENVAPGLHSVGTSSMSPKGAKWGVVDPDLKVKGAIGLRVVDASVLPLVPAGHTQVPTYIVAERAADLIKNSW